MYNQILFPTDGSEPAEAALDYVVQVAAEHDATLHVLNVTDISQVSLHEVRDDVLDGLEREGQTIVDEAAQHATDRGITTVSEVVRGDPYRSIVEYSNGSGVDLIAMPTHGRHGLERFLLGSVTERVINTAEVPVVAINPDRNQPLTYPCRELLVPIDGSRGADLALTEGIAVAEETGATLHLLHVVETGSPGADTHSPLADERSERAKEIISEATAATESSVPEVETAIEYGAPAKRIQRYIDEHGIELAVLGVHGETEFSRYMMGGVSAKIIRTAEIPVMWVREPATSQ
ncbi:MAG: universal stress protein [Halolamina sp.]